MKRSLALVLLVCGELALGQDKPALRVVVDGIGREAEACGVRAPAIESAAAQALKANGIEVSAAGGGAYLYLNVNAYRVMQDSTVVGCTTRLGVSVRAAAGEAQVRGFKPKADAYVVVCEAGRLLSGSQRDVAGAVAKAFEEDIRSCLGQLNY